MGAGSAAIGTVLDRYRILLDRLDEVARAAAQPEFTDPCGDCRACCGPLSLLPLEAYALLSSGALGGGAPSEGICPLLDDDGCRVTADRPFACRARGLPARQLSAEGDMVVGSCERSAANDHGRNGRGPVAPLDEWAGELVRLDREFRDSTGIPPGRIALADLCRKPDRYRALSVAGGLALVSRSAR